MLYDDAKQMVEYVGQALKQTSSKSPSGNNILAA
jgi:hypothetical protein